MLSSRSRYHHKQNVRDSKVACCTAHVSTLNPSSHVTASQLYLTNTQGPPRGYLLLSVEIRGRGAPNAPRLVLARVQGTSFSHDLKRLCTTHQSYRTTVGYQQCN